MPRAFSLNWDEYKLAHPDACPELPNCMARNDVDLGGEPRCHKRKTHEVCMIFKEANKK